MEQYWFFLTPNSFLWIKGCVGIVYNSDNGESFTFKNKGSLKGITEKLTNIDNLYCIDIDGDAIDSSIRRWVDNIVSIKAGGLLRKVLGNIKPICYFPLLNIQSTTIRQTENEDEYLYENLNSLTVYLNTDKHGFTEYKKQVVFPAQAMFTFEDTELDASELINFLKWNHIDSIVSNIDICGDLFSYRDWPLLSGFLESSGSVNVTLFLRYPTLIDNYDYLFEHKHLFKFNLNILVTANDNLDRINELRQLLLSIFENVVWSYTVTSMQDIDIYERVTNSTTSPTDILLPIYDAANNSSFFEEFVYLEEKDVKSVGLSKQEVFANQAINTFFWGKLILDTDGRVYTNLNFNPIGDISNTVASLIAKAIFEDDSAWKLTREKEPCSDCVYQYLCPSPSNYEIASGKLNLCQIRYPQI